MANRNALESVFNFAAFQAGWLICVLFTNLLAACAALALILVHLRWVSAVPATEALFILVGTLAGTVLDSLWLATGVLSTTPASSLAPLWLVALWGLFMTTLSHSLAWLGGHRVLPYLLAPIAGPAAYWAASGLGAVDIGDQMLATGLLAVGWMLLLPSLLSLRKRYFPSLVR
ncbi:DUF2878 domain-containing protein [Marinobacter sp. SS21]|uniref:DUF2878 domain-containing protein n=1 Tax=Marinobacter sp. SS21 TaxID=2979460 RepID=UPI0023312512|nr:DUF2878 domain-containing protein [Marinobacter sp. SS21]MDC0661818.1 DUF2878 domain-containing protein [Marinobacter sp. SS21]